MKNQKKILLGVLGALIVGAVVFGSANSSMFQGFLDFGNIKKVEENDSNLTRAEFAALLVNKAGIEMVQCDNFADVPEDSWYNGPICALVEAGVFAGFQDGNFQPMGTITRAEAAKAIYSTFGVEYACPLPKLYPDVAAGNWYYDYVNKLGAYSFFDREVSVGSNFRPGDLLRKSAATKWFRNLGNL